MISFAPLFILPKFHIWVENSYGMLWVIIMHHIQNPKGNMGDNLSYTLKDDEICNSLPKGLSIFIIKYAESMNIQEVLNHASVF